MSARHGYTDDERAALVFGLMRAEETVARRRMIQCEAFCRGDDERAAKYDGPDSPIATAERHRAALDGMVNRAYGIEVAS